jgi:hypothetical protein
VLDPLIINALRGALRAEHPVRLVSAGKRPDVAGLFPSTAKKYAQAIAICLDKEQPLLDVVREETVKAKIYRFVIVNDRGIGALVSSVPAEEHENLMREAAPRHRANLAEKCVAVARRSLAEFAARQRQLSEMRQQTTAAALQLTEAYLKQIDTERQRLGEEQAASAEAEARLRLEAARPPALPNTAEPQASPTTRSSEEELNFQRDISEELVYAWRDAETQETKEALARALFNVGVVRVGELGERVPYDGRWQDTQDELNVGDVVEIVRPGWRLVNLRGSYLITRAVVRKALDAKENTT